MHNKFDNYVGIYVLLFRVNYNFLMPYVSCNVYHNTRGLLRIIVLLKFKFIISLWIFTYDIEFNIVNLILKFLYMDNVRKHLVF